VRVINDPRGLRDANEKLFSLHFPQCIPPTIIARDAAEIRRFVAEHGDVVLKPLDGMGGRSIFRSGRGDPNLNVIIETLTAEGRNFTVAQRYIPEIRDGDKRILMIDGEPVPYVLARMPQGDDFRGNLARGGKGVGRPLSEGDRRIAALVGPELRRRGMRFVGLDAIGDYLTEVNVTSPTCIRELDAQFGLNIAGMLFDALEATVS
jgi:glutathione synthase